MFCYRDSTFCISPNCENECGRKLTPEIEAAAKQWWKQIAPDDEGGAPIAMSYFCGGQDESNNDEEK